MTFANAGCGHLVGPRDVHPALCEDCRLAQIARLRAENAELVAFIEKWTAIIQGGDKINLLEGWAKEHVTEAHDLLARIKKGE